MHCKRHKNLSILIYVLLTCHSVEEHGEMSVETVDALEVYGNALLKNAIASSAVLGGEAAAGKAASTEPTAKKVKDSESN